MSTTNDMSCQQQTDDCSLFVALGNGECAMAKLHSLEKVPKGSTLIFVDTLISLKTAWINWGKTVY